MPLLPNAFINDVRLPRMNHHLRVKEPYIKALQLSSDLETSNTLTIDYEDIWGNPLLLELAVVFENDLGIAKLFNVLSAFSFTLLQAPSLHLTLQLLITGANQTINPRKQGSLTQLTHKKQEITKKLQSAIWLYYDEALVELRLAISNGDVKLVKAISKILGAVSFFANTSFQEATFFDDCAIGVIKEHVKNYNDKFRPIDGVLITPYMYQFKALWFPSYSPRVLLEFSNVLDTLKPLMSNARRAIRALFSWLEQYLRKLLTTIDSEMKKTHTVAIDSIKMPLYSNLVREMWINCPSRCHYPETIFQVEKKHDLENVVHAMYFVLLSLLSAIFPTLQIIPHGNTKNVNAREYFHIKTNDAAKLSKTKVVMSKAFDYCWKISTFFYCRQLFLCLLGVTYRDKAENKVTHPSETHLNLNEVTIVEFLKNPIRSFNYPHMPFMIKHPFIFVDEFKISGLEFENFYTKNIHHYDIFRRKTTMSPIYERLQLRNDSNTSSTAWLQSNLPEKNIPDNLSDKDEVKTEMTLCSVLEIEKELHPESKRSQISAAIEHNTYKRTSFLNSILDKTNMEQWEFLLYNDYEEVLYSDILNPTDNNSLDDETLSKTSESSRSVSDSKLKRTISKLSSSSEIYDFNPWFLLGDLKPLQEVIDDGQIVYDNLDELAQLRQRTALLYLGSN